MLGMAFAPSHCCSMKRERARKKVGSNWSQRASRRNRLGTFPLSGIPNEESTMRATLLTLPAVAIVSVLGLAPAGAGSPTEFSSQGLAIEVPGVGVRVGEPDRRRYHRDRRWRERDVRSGCRTVTVRQETPYGTRTRSKTEC
jgi:hypothetical protein